LAGTVIFWPVLRAPAARKNRAPTQGLQQGQGLGALRRNGDAGADGLRTPGVVATTTGLGAASGGAVASSARAFQ
jgi:hypothetical protein